MAKRLTIMLLAVALLWQPGLVSADVPAAVGYLEAQSPDAWITMALVSSGQTNPSTDHLTSVSGTLATDYAKAILAIAATGHNPETLGNVNYVSQLKNYYSDNQMGDSSLVNDDFWAGLALASIRQGDSPQAVAAKNFIIANQNSDGGWGYAVGGPSDTNDTSAAVMALIELGVSPSDSVIVNAIAYLQSAQNEDGGIGYDVSSNSDSGSDAWTISALNKAGINPASWDQAGSNPISHLQSLQDSSDGGFWWVEEGSSDFNNKAMTAFAVVALSGDSYPVGYYEPVAAGAYHLRIEGSTGTICDANIEATTALNIIEAASEICSFTYTIQETSFGPYLSAINSDQAVGLSGWLYFVNDETLEVGSADYNLQSGDEVLWYFGEWGWNPTRVIIDSTEFDTDDNINIQAKYYNGSAWLPLPDANIVIGTQNHAAASDGSLEIQISSNGIYDVYVDTPGFVRSSKVEIQVGEGVSQNVGLSVEIDQGGGTIGGQSIALIVDPNNLDFGTITPGQSVIRDLNVVNDGTVSINLEANVFGDPVFINGLDILGNDWQEFSDFLAPDQGDIYSVSLTVPSSYTGSGVKSGELIIWASSN